MQRILFVSMTALVACLVLGSLGAAKEVTPTFTILFDNVPYAEGYRTSWGYACLIRGL